MYKKESSRELLIIKISFPLSAPHYPLREHIVTYLSWRWWFKNFQTVGNCRTSSFRLHLFLRLSSTLSKFGMNIGRISQLALLEDVKFAWDCKWYFIQCEFHRKDCALSVFKDLSANLSMRMWLEVLRINKLGKSCTYSFLQYVTGFTRRGIWTPFSNWPSTMGNITPLGRRWTAGIISYQSPVWYLETRTRMFGWSAGILNSNASIIWAVIACNSM